jgi:hypothetical protein
MRHLEKETRMNFYRALFAGLFMGLVLLSVGPASASCYPNGQCPDGSCAPMGSVCCGNGQYCPSGNLCYPGGKCLPKTHPAVCRDGNTFCKDLSNRCIYDRGNQCVGQFDSYCHRSRGTSCPSSSGGCCHIPDSPYASSSGHVCCKAGTSCVGPDGNQRCE